MIKFPAQYAKFITAIVGQALTYVQWEYGSSNKWVTLATAAAAALGVYAVPNASKPPPPSNLTVTSPAATVESPVVQK